MKKFTQWLENNHVAIIFTMLMLTVLGVYMFLTLPKDVFPNARFPRFQIVVDTGFNSLENTDIGVTRPLEDSLKTVPGIVEVRSITERGTSTIDLYFKWGTDLDQAFGYVQSKISQARSALPPETSIDVIRMTVNAFAMSEYGIWSDKMSQKELYTFVKYSMIPKLIGVDGIFSLTVIGGEQPEIWVKMIPQKLISYNLDVAEIAKAIDKANTVSFIGNVVNGKDSYFAIGGDKLKDIDDIRNIVIATRMGAPVYLRDVANLQESHAELRRIVSISGHKGLFIDVRKQDDADGIKVAGILDEKMAEVSKERPDLHISKWDLSDFVRQSISGIMTDISAGIIIILFIVYYVLNRFRYSIPVIIMLPIVIILEFVVLKILGMTINIMTLGGLSAAIGIIADNAIVVAENYARFRSSGSKNPLSDSLSYIVPIMLWATAASMVVFIPLNILSGVPGLFFKPLAITLVTTIAVSLVMAIFVIPLFIKSFEGSKAQTETGENERVLFRSLKRYYLILLDKALLHKYAVAASVGLLICVSVFIFTKIPSGFLPDWDEGDIVFDYYLHTGISLKTSDEISFKIEEVLKSIPDIEMYIRRTGTDMANAYLPPNIGEIVVLLKKDRRHSTFETIESLRKAIETNVPEAEADFHQILPDRLGDLTGVAKPVVINVLGSDIDKLWDGARQVKDKLEKVQGLNDVIIDMPAAQKEIKVVPDGKRVSILGLTLNDVYYYCGLALYGEVASNLVRGTQIIPIRNFYEGNFRNDINSISKIPVYTPNGGVLPLGRLATFVLKEQTPEIHHKNGSIVISVFAEITGRSLGDVVKDIKLSLADIKKEDFTLELEGNYKNQQTSFKELLFVLLVSVLFILAILLFIFESYTTAIAVFLGTVASATFVVIGLFVLHTEFNVSSFTGLITVMGIVVNNGILVIDFVERSRREGSGVTGSIMSAGNIRFRPVLITNLAAIAGFLPMALNLGSGGEVLRPFSIAMICGLIGSMFFSLVVMPVFYAIVHREVVKP